ncbi:hypothetical protein GBAR_LOCUS15707 [Geodia barretti]|uniref:Uncharacterized protein n=1 Tax=Geodia barretti TaxID=519541 RepID=A0AA35WSK3_GEOBA|nr:hypothetical protein GBAR_LOCUS15707 [Geodia barretti]
MPVSVEQWRAAVGAMARSSAPKPRSPIGPHWNKWLKASDPVAYKGCVFLLVTIAQLVRSGLEQAQEKTEEMVKEGSERVCQSAIRGKTRVAGNESKAQCCAGHVTCVSTPASYCVNTYSNSTITVNTSGAGSGEWRSGSTSEEAVGSDCVWTRAVFGPVQVCSMILLPPLTQLSLSGKHPWHHGNGCKPSSDEMTERVINVVLETVKELMKCVCVCVCEALLYVGQSLSLLKRCLQCWAWLVYRKFSKKTVAEGVCYLMSLLFSNRKRPGLSEVTMIGFVNQMLLMMAGDVEQNPGPDTLTTNDLATLVNELNEMLCAWLSKIDPTWQKVVDALSSPAIGKQSAAEQLKLVYCKPNPTPAPGSSRKPYETLKAKIVNLERAFAKLRIGVYRRVRDEPVDVFIAGLLAMDVNGQEHHRPILTEITQDKKTVLEVWVKLSPYLNFLNYEILQHILFNFSDDNLQREMEDYESQMEKFFEETRLCDFLDCWPVRGKTPPVGQLCDFVVKHNKDWNTCTLRDLDLLEKSLARKLFLPTFAVLLRDAGPGCVSVTFSVPALVAPQLQTVIKGTELKEFADMEIETITVDGVVCYATPLLQYTSLLKQLYTSRSPLTPLSDSKPKPLLPFRLARIEKQSLSTSDMDRFTRESLRGDMDDVVYKKTAMELSQLGVMGDGSRPQVVLIEGAPGVGARPTFAWHQCRQWQQRASCFRPTPFVLTAAPQRTATSDKSAPLPASSDTAEEQVREEVILRSDSLFAELIRGIQLPAATIFITSRPWATGGLLETVGDRLSQHTELLPLAKEEISAAIVEQVFKSAPHNPPTTVTWTLLYSAYVLMRLEQHPLRASGIQPHEHQSEDTC